MLQSTTEHLAVATAAAAARTNADDRVAALRALIRDLLRETREVGESIEALQTRAAAQEGSAASPGADDRQHTLAPPTPASVGGP